MKKCINIFLFLITGFLISCEQKDVILEGNLDIIPQVNKMVVKNDAYYLLKNQVNINVESDSLKIPIHNFIKFLDSYGYFETKFVEKDHSADIRLFSNAQLGKEAYKLSINNGGIKIEAASNAGFFYGFQTLRQMFPVLNGNTKNITGIKLPYVQITDAPRFKWRGMMLDVSRHFYTVDEIKRLIDNLALLKINTFHWHLVDDQGWRIEIKKYPKLTKVGAWRVNQEDVPWNERKENSLGDSADFGGFYSQEEIKEVVAYAASKYITVVPEIELPAHVMSAIAAYPELSCSGKPIMVPSGGVWPITDIYCPGKESTFEFIENVLDEVIELFHRNTFILAEMKQQRPTGKPARTARRELQHKI